MRSGKGRGEKGLLGVLKLFVKSLWPVDVE